MSATISSPETSPSPTRGQRPLSALILVDSSTEIGLIQKMARYVGSADFVDKAALISRSAPENSETQRNPAASRRAAAVMAAANPHAVVHSYDPASGVEPISWIESAAARTDLVISATPNNLLTLLVARAAVASKKTPLHIKSTIRVDCFEAGGACAECWAQPLAWQLHGRLEPGPEAMVQLCFREDLLPGTHIVGKTPCCGQKVSLRIPPRLASAGCRLCGSAGRGRVHELNNFDPKTHHASQADGWYPDGGEQE